MKKEQLEKANTLSRKIRDTTDIINLFNEPQKVRRVQISTQKDGGREMYMNTLFERDDSLHCSNGLFDDIFLSKAEIIAKGYVESVIAILKEQLKSLEDQLEEI